MSYGWNRDQAGKIFIIFDYSKKKRLTLDNI